MFKNDVFFIFQYNISILKFHPNLQSWSQKFVFLIEWLFAFKYFSARSEQKTEAELKEDKQTKDEQL